jgi:hypothetical protein
MGETGPQMAHSEAVGEAICSTASGAAAFVRRRRQARHGRASRRLFLCLAAAMVVFPLIAGTALADAISVDAGPFSWDGSFPRQCPHGYDQGMWGPIHDQDPGTPGTQITVVTTQAVNCIEYHWTDCEGNETRTTSGLLLRDDFAENSLTSYTQASEGSQSPTWTFTSGLLNQTRRTYATASLRRDSVSGATCASAYLTPKFGSEAIVDLLVATGAKDSTNKAFLGSAPRPPPSSAGPPGLGRSLPLRPTPPPVAPTVRCGCTSTTGSST